MKLVYIVEFKISPILAIGGSTVAGPSPHHPEVPGLNPATAAATGRANTAKKLIKSFVEVRKKNMFLLQLRFFFSFKLFFSRDPIFFALQAVQNGCS